MVQAEEVLDYDMMCKNPIRITKNLDRIKFPEGLEVPCGKCLQCRINKRKEWSMRLLHELEYWDSSMFLTLTYDDNHIPENGSLRKSHLQKFFKRVRKELKGKKIKYYACGEYGTKTFRPHYHAIIYGLGLNSDDKLLIMSKWPYCDWNQPSINKNSFGLVETYSIQYVAGYIHDKLSGEEEKFMYDDTGRENVFKIQSLGFGKQYCLDNAERILNDKFISIFNKKHSVPRYYLNKLGVTEEEMQSFRDKAIEKDIENVYNLTGQYMTFDELYQIGQPIDVNFVVKKVTNDRIQNDRNITAKQKLKRRKF